MQVRVDELGAEQTPPPVPVTLGLVMDLPRGGHVVVPSTACAIHTLIGRGEHLFPDIKQGTDYPFFSAVINE